MVTIIGILVIVLLFIGDIAVLIKGIDDWKKKIDSEDKGRRKNLWLLVFYIVTPLLVILMLYVWGIRCN